MIYFRPFQEKHLTPLRVWLKEKHIIDHWRESDDTEVLKRKFIHELPKRGVSAFVIERNSLEIGYIQYYDATKVGGDWWRDEKPGTFGIDLMIGVPDFVGIGFGQLVIKEFIALVRSKEPGVSSIIVDPAPQNKRAIRAFEKAGFVREDEIVTPGGPALLMRIRLA